MTTPTTFEKHFTVFIGRFQPFHNGHYYVVKQALELSDNLIIVLGSHRKAPSLANPFSSEQRTKIIRSTLTPEENERVIITCVEDHAYIHSKWIAEVQKAVSSAIFSHGFIAGPTKISLIGHKKDTSSFYLKMFPNWESIDVESHTSVARHFSVPTLAVTSATDIREFIYENYGHIDEDVLSRELLIACSDNSFAELVEEWKFVNQYHIDWGYGPFNTVDNIVTLGGHILLIKRGDFPGRGQWALPGGFLNRDELIEDACFRELREETKLAVPEPILRGSLVNRQVYDAIGRDPRARIITHAFHVAMSSYGGNGTPEDIKLPKVKGSDDAKKAKWFTLAEVAAMRPKIFGDHYDIMEHLGII